jgi:hypothetical protein
MDGVPEKWGSNIAGEAKIKTKTIWFRMPTHRLLYRVRKDAG